MEQKGFTLIEILSSLTIFIIVILMIGSFFSLAQISYNNGISKNELSQNARVSIDRITRELRQTNFLVNWTASSGTPEHEIFFEDGHNKSYISYIRYYLNGSDLYREHTKYSNGGMTPYLYFNGIWDTEEIISNEIIAEYFDHFNMWNDNGLIHFDFGYAKNKATLNFVTDVYIRNY